MTAATMRVQPTRLAGRDNGGGDAQGRAATNPVAALPCARTPLLSSLLHPLSAPLLGPSSATVSPHQALKSSFGLVEGDDPGRSRAKTTRDRPGSVGKLKQWRTTHSRLHAGAFLTGRPPTNPMGDLPAGSRRHHRRHHHAEWSYG